MKYRYIIFDGPDGVGKTTQLEKFAEFIADKQPIKAKALGGLGNDFLLNQLRALLLHPSFPGTDVASEERLFAVAHTRNLNIIEKYLDANYIVLQDRGQISDVIYCKAKNLNDDEIYSYQGFMHEKYNQIYKKYKTLHVVFIPEDEQIILQRIHARGQPIIPRLENTEMQKKVINYLKGMDAHVKQFLGTDCDILTVPVTAKDTIDDICQKLISNYLRLESI